MSGDRRVLRQPSLHRRRHAGLQQLRHPARGQIGVEVREKGSAPKGGSALYDIFGSSVKTLLVKCPSVQGQPDGLTVHTQRWFL